MAILYISSLLCNKCFCCREAHVSQVQSFFFTIGITAAISVVLGCLPRNICSPVESIVFSSGNETLFLSLSTDFVKESSTTYFFCEGSQLRWDWLLDRARAYTCLRWPRPQVSQNESVDFICWWTISGLVVKAILRTGGATTQQPSSMREQSVWLEPILSYQTNIKQKSNK